MNLKYEYECALSGVTAPGELPHAEDGLDDLPQGWFEVRLSRRTPNPKWLLIQRVKEAMVSALIGQFPKEVRDAQEVAVRVQLDAQFFALENATSPYITDVETVYLAPPESSEDIAEAVNQFREMVGLSPMEAGDDEDEDDDGVEPPQSAVEPAPAPVAVGGATAAGEAVVGNKRVKKPLPEART